MEFTITLSILSSRDADPNIEYSLSFTVSHGPPSKIKCTFGSNQILTSDTVISREVIRSQFVNSSEPDVTHVTVRPGPQPRVGATYICNVHVESRTNIDNIYYDFDDKGMGSTTATVTGE